MSRSRATLAGRITVLCLAVAGISALVAGLILFRLVTTTSRDVTRRVLANQADVIAAQIAEQGGGLVGRRRVVDILEGQGISVVGVGQRGLVTGTPEAVAAAKQAKAVDGGKVSKIVESGGRTYLVEARDVPRGSFVLVQQPSADRSTVRSLIGNILLGLGIGLLVAALAGIVLGRLLARPLRRTAQVAHTMRGGRRDLRVPVEGPREVADVAGSVNELADALQRSESRQRDFLLSVSHELRTPLTAVRGFAESLADGVVTGADAADVGRTICNEAQRLERLVSDLLDLARLSADDFRLDITRVDLTGVAREAADVWSARCAREGVTFRAEIPEHPVLANTDPRRLRQALDGLMENALRVTPSGQPIVLALSPNPVFQVRDGGPGLSEEDYQVAFDRGALYRRYAGVRPVGTGLGLAIVHGLVTRMGGTVHAGPAPEGGASFTIMLAG
ncbi:signal transduction histidine kinase [Kibdelosporangium banguiense]|uniref:Signal transduction histidine-protein kinase/phosphatase MprB n=1 Tax=Kibdelosporangium banguiense TaxID=1365924 RepID=A0ABS4TAU5_9PSEU|nr:HAMP domain-containing sensor histidine kinase [Kibdelosporangium banguiense]MBP2320993.1 signal transduction histidine kinase [Kibdelosporangium banguiense]